MTTEARLGEGKGGGLTNLQVLYKDLIAYTRCFVALIRGEELDSNAVSYLNTFTCNSIGSSTLEQVRYRHKKANSSTLGLNTSNHVKLLAATAAEYERLTWAQTRLMLAGEEGLAVEDPGKSIRPDETPAYVLAAESQGVIINKVRPIPEVQLGIGSVGVILSLQPLGFYFGREALVEGDSRVKRDVRFRDQILRAGIHKLGCLLAVTDQLTFEKRIKGHHVDPEYATWVGGNEETLYLSMFNEPKLPGIHAVYQKSHSLLLSSADPNDPLLQHLFPMTALSNLK